MLAAYACIYSSSAEKVKPSIERALLWERSAECCTTQLPKVIANILIKFKGRIFCLCKRSTLLSLATDVWTRATKRALSPRSMVQNIRRVGKQFRPNRQEDAHEYLRQLLDCMNEEILKANHVKISDGKIAETTLISQVFGGYLQNELKCPLCRFSSKTFNHFQDLSLEISGGITSGLNRKCI